MQHEILYKQNLSNANDILTHLKACDQVFYDNLVDKVVIDMYCVKLENYSERFEAWLDNILVGVIAIYINDFVSKQGFITNVSVIPKYYRKGIAQHLIQNAISFASKIDFNCIFLEVEKTNVSAIFLYKKLGFLEIKEKKSFLVMQLKLS